MGILQVPLIIFLAVVAPLWIIAHYVTSWKRAKLISANDEKLLGELYESAERMEARIQTLDKILDAEAPDWRTKE